MQAIAQKIRITSLAAVMSVVCAFAMPATANANTPKIMTEVMQGFKHGQTLDEAKAHVRERGGNADLVECKKALGGKSTTCYIHQAMGIETFLGLPVKTYYLSFNTDSKLYDVSIFFDLDRIQGNQDRVSSNLLRKIREMAKPAKLESALYGMYRVKHGDYNLMYGSRHPNDSHFPAAVHARITLSVSSNAIDQQMREAEALAAQEAAPGPGWFTRFMKWARS